ncbi:MAG: division/cell wall cluster transcriptional repressor MraZ [Acidimicrobiales bacterium]
MFVGQYEHALDDKGRVVLPAPFRAHVAERGYVTLLDGCIGLWSPEDFRAVAEKWKAESEASRISMRVFRKLMNSVRDVKLDSAGRITLPRELLNELGFASQVVVSGLFDRVEIWPAEAYAADQGSEETAAELAEAVARLGL